MSRLRLAMTIDGMSFEYLPPTGSRSPRATAIYGRRSRLAGWKARPPPPFLNVAHGGNASRANVECRGLTRRASARLLHDIRKDIELLICVRVLYKRETTTLARAHHREVCDSRFGE